MISLVQRLPLQLEKPDYISLAVIKLETFLIKEPVMIEFIAGDVVA